MSIRNAADLVTEVLHSAGVRRIYGVVGDSLNGITESQPRLSMFARNASFGYPAVASPKCCSTSPEFRFVCLATGGRILGSPDIDRNGMGIPFDDVVAPQSLLDPDATAQDWSHPAVCLAFRDKV